MILDGAKYGGATDVATSLGDWRYRAASSTLGLRFNLLLVTPSTLHQLKHFDSFESARA